MENIAKKLVEKIDGSPLKNNIATEDAIFNIEKDEFSKIIKTHDESSIAFIDGGSQQIIKSPSLSLFFNRVYCCTYKKNKRIGSRMVEFFSFINTDKVSDKLIYRTEIIFTEKKVNLKNHTFDATDPRISFRGKVADIALVGNIVRRFAELCMVQDTDSDFVAIDGSLTPQYPHEETLMKTAFKGKAVCGLSKTTTELSSYGTSIIPLLQQNSIEGAWYYHCTDKLGFAKLYKDSRYVFKVEFNDDAPAKQILSLLSQNSIDPIFPGYPYGLVDADRFGRVSNQETEQIFLRLKVLLKEDFNRIEPYLNSLNAHSILDSIG